MIPRVRLAGGMTVRDLNERKDLGTFEVLEMTLPAHYAKLLRVEDKKCVNVVTVGNPEVMIPLVDAIVLTPVE